MQEVNIFGKIQQGQMGNFDIIKNIEWNNNTRWISIHFVPSSYSSLYNITILRWITSLILDVTKYDDEW